MKKAFFISLLVALLMTAGCGQSTRTVLTDDTAQTALTDDTAQTGSTAEQQDTALRQQGTANRGTAVSETTVPVEDTAQNEPGTTPAVGEQQPGTESPDLEAISARLPANIKNYLIDNAEKLAAEYRPDSPGLPEPIKITDTCSILDYTAGKLDTDSYDDLAVIIEDAGDTDPETGSASRRLLVLSRLGQDKYGIVNYNSDLILGAEEGGVFGDPYSGIAIKNNTLSVAHYGGSNYRWGYEHEFAYEGGVLKLIRLTETDEYTGTGNGTKSVFDLNELSLKEYAEYLDSSSEKLIYECAIEKKDFTFNNLSIEDMNLDICTAKYLPELDAYDYANGTMLSADNTPDKVLDIIRKTWFPDFEKVEFSWTEETRRNYESICFFKTAGYYYEKGETTLHYWKAEADDSGDVRHIVHYRGYDPTGQPKFISYYYNDKTGEISIT